MKGYVGLMSVPAVPSLFILKTTRYYVVTTLSRTFRNNKEGRKNVEAAEGTLATTQSLFFLTSSALVLLAITPVFIDFLKLIFSK